MAIIEKLIRMEADGTISFGNYELSQKEKVADFEVGGNLYKVKSFNDITKLTKDGALVYESLPGTAVHCFKATDRLVTFEVWGKAESQVTMELSPSTEYHLFIDGVKIGKIKSSLAGKINFSVDCSKEAKKVEIRK